MSFFTELFLVLSRPRYFFRETGPYDVWEATRFAIFVWILTVLVIVGLWQLGIPAGNIRGLLGDRIVMTVLPLRLVLLSMTLIGVLWVSAFVLHGAARWLGGSGDFTGTFTVVAFSSASVIFNVLPVIGSWLAYYELVILIVGIKEHHQLSWSKAAFTVGVLVPLAILIALWRR